MGCRKVFGISRGELPHETPISQVSGFEETSLAHGDDATSPGEREDFESGR